MNDEARATDEYRANAIESPVRAPAGDPDRLLDAVTRLRDLEVQKRTQPVSTPEYQRLADAVERESRRVFRLADEEHETGPDSRPDAPR